MSDVKAFHIGRSTRGIRVYYGGYCVVVRLRKDGKYNVTIVQCSPSHRYSGPLGIKIGLARMNKGKFFVNSVDELVDTLTTLSDKMGGTEPSMENLDG